MKMLILAIAILQRRNLRPAHACCPPRFPWAAREGQAREGRGAGCCEGRCGGRAWRCGTGLDLRSPGGARPPRHATTAAAAVFVQLALRRGRNWAAQWHLARAVGKPFRGCRAKRLYVYTVLCGVCTVYYGAFRYLHGVLRCMMVPYGVLRCIAVHCGVLWCRVCTPVRSSYGFVMVSKPYATYGAPLSSDTASAVQVPRDAFSLLPW